MIRPILIMFVFVMAFVAVPTQLRAANFDDAQTAAREGRYEDVVDILSSRIAKGGLDDEALVIAYANRGIAYSLIQAYGLAKQDLNTAIKMDPDHVLTQNHLGILAEHVDNDVKLAADWYQQAAVQGFAAAQTNLGDLYLHQKIPTEEPGQSYSTAKSWYEKAAAQDYALAEIALGVMYRDGLGVTKDPGLSVELFGKAAKAGAAKARYYLGVAYEKGQGVARNFQQAAVYYQKAAENGDAQAQNALGYLYRRGAGVSKDYAEAIHWYQLAAEQGLAEAINRLAWLLATCPDKQYCDGELALTLAKQAVDLDSSAGYLDTLAAAYARNGNYPEAIETAQKLLSQLPSGSVRFNKYQGRLKRYRESRPFQL